MIYTKRTGEEIEYIPKEEADARNISYIPWREATEAGQWILTDDNFVLQTSVVKLLKEEIPWKTDKNKKIVRYRKMIRTPLATRFPHSKIPFILQQHIDTRNTTLIPRPWWRKREISFPGLREEVIQAFLTGKLPWSRQRKYNRDHYAEMIRIAAKVCRGKTSSMSWLSVRMYINKDEVRMSLQEEIAKIAEKEGFNVQKVFSLLKDAEEIAKQEGHSGTLVAIADRVAKIVSMPHMLKGPKEGDRLPPKPDEDPNLPGSDAHFDKFLQEKEIPDESAGEE